MGNVEENKNVNCCVSFAFKYRYLKRQLRDIELCFDFIAKGIILSNKIINHEAVPVAERLRTLFLNHSTISPLCLVWVRAPLWPHVRQANFCLQVCQLVFLGVLSL